MTPLEQAVEAMQRAHDEAMSQAIWGAQPFGGVFRPMLLAALDVLGPVIVEKAWETNPRIAEQFPETPRYPDWPSLRDAITQEPPR